MALPFIEQIFNSVESLKTKVDNKVDKTLVNLTNKNLNEITETGLYYVTFANCTNTPIAAGTNGYLIVIALTSNFSLQKYFTYNKNQNFERRNVNGSWTDWQES